MYRIKIEKAATRVLKELSVAERVRIVQAIDGLKTNPHPHGAVKLSGGQGLYRLRSGDYRVIYRIENAELLVLVVKVGHRREVYR